MESEKDKTRLAQAAEAELRRKQIGDEYHITEDEERAFGLKLKAIAESLPDAVSLADIAAAYDSMASGSVREQELKQALVDSALGKVSESIRYFLPQNLQGEFASLLTDISEQLHGNERKFSDFRSIYNRLLEFKATMEKNGVTEEGMVKAYIQELKKFNASK